MHELSIAENIIEICEASAAAQDSRHIRTIKLRLGEFTTIVSEALQFSFEIARRGTLAENATLEIESVPMVTRCGACGDSGETSQEVCLICTECGAPLEIVSGDEMQVEYIEID
jgi:hydrogenase nickel incorporation protein HypA/HybF